MSTLKVDAIRHNSATSDAITTAADGTCTAKLTSVGGGGLSHRNKVINGSMIINQRSSSYTATGEEYLLDRFNHRTGSGFTFDTTTTQDTSAPDGFTKSLKITPDSTQTPSGSHNGMIGHLIEADNLLGFASGTSSAKSFALSFYAKSSSQNNNHQYSVQISKVNSGGTYYYQNRSFVVTSSWQRFTVVFPADTSNNIATGNGEGLRILWHLSAGPDDIASAVTSWTSSNGNHAVTGQSNFMDNTSNEFYLTGVQLEVGDTATTFEHLTFAEELTLCERYYQIIKPTIGEAQNTTNIQGVLRANPAMRATPSASILNNSNNVNLAGSGPNSVTSIGTIYYNGTTGGWAEMGGTGFTQHRNYFILGDKFAFSAEL